MRTTISSLMNELNQHAAGVYQEGHGLRGTVDNMGAKQAAENIVNQLPMICQGEIHALRAAVENGKSALTDVNLSADSVDNRDGDQANRLRQLNGLFRGLQSHL